MRTVVLLCLCAALALAACSPEEVPPGPTVTSYYVKASINGAAFTATHAVIASQNGTFLNIRGSAGTGFPNLAISLDAAKLGTNIVGGNTANQVIWTSSDASDPNTIYRAALGVGRGSVVLSRLDDKVQGTFEIVAMNADKDSVVITGGTFYAALQP